MIINFDNAATTYPKPQGVKRAVVTAMEKYGGNAGRGGHQLAMQTSSALYSARETAADFFGAEPENVIFTINRTYALNMAIQGIMSNGRAYYRKRNGTQFGCTSCGGNGPQRKNFNVCRKDLSGG